METILLNEKSSVEDYLKIGDEIWNCLVEIEKIEDWLSIFDDAEPENREMVHAIRYLDLPVATANYDNLLEDILLLTPIAPLDTHRVEKFLDP